MLLTSLIYPIARTIASMTFNDHFIGFQFRFRFEPNGTLVQFPFPSYYFRKTQAELTHFQPISREHLVPKQ